MFRRSAAWILAAAIMILASVVSYAANTGIRSSFDLDGDSVELRPASSTDYRESDFVNDSKINLDGVQSVSISAGSVSLQIDEETSELSGSALAEGLRASNDYGYYIDLQSNNLGSRLYVPSDYAEDSFYVSSGNLYGMRNSTFTCYIGQYSVRFPAYGRPQYRLTSGSTMQWTDIDIPYSDSPNVSVLGARENYWSDKVQTLILLLIGGLAVCLYLKR